MLLHIASNTLYQGSSAADPLPAIKEEGNSTSLVAHGGQA
jgi:hypothetical protein